MLDLILWCMAYAAFVFVTSGLAVYGLNRLVDWLTDWEDAE